MVVEPLSVRRRQHFQTTSPLKLQAEPFHISHIASIGGGNEYFNYICVLLFRSDKNSGCYGNLKFLLTYMEKSGNWHFPSGWGYLNFVFT